MTMGVFPANMSSRNIEYCEEAGRHERQLPPKLSNQKVAPHIVYSLQPVQCDALHRGLSGARECIPRRWDRAIGETASLRIDVADDTCRIPGHNGVRLNTARDDRPGTDHRIMSYRQPRKDRRSRANRGISADRRDRIGRLMVFAPREMVIRECCIWSNKDIVFDDQPVAQLGAGFHRDAVTEDHLFFNEYMIADIAVATDNGAAEDMGKRPDPRTWSHLGCFAEALRMNKIAHGDLPKLFAVRTINCGRALVVSQLCTAGG